MTSEPWGDQHNQEAATLGCVSTFHELRWPLQGYREREGTAWPGGWPMGRSPDDEPSEETLLLPVNLTSTPTPPKNASFLASLVMTCVFGEFSARYWLEWSMFLGHQQGGAHTSKHAKERKEKKSAIFFYKPQIPSQEKIIFSLRFIYYILIFVQITYGNRGALQFFGIFLKINFTF